MSKIIGEILVDIKKEKPYILNVTNYYTMNFVADGIRSLGAIPIMSNAKKEVEDLLKRSRSVVISLGKLDDDFILLCQHICALAKKYEKPVILDPVGAGVSEYRTDVSLNLLKDNNISVMRVYETEMAAIYLGDQGEVYNEKPVTHAEAIKYAQAISQKYDIAIVLNGNENSVIDGDEVEHVNFNSYFLTRVAGISNLLTSVIGVFHGIEKHRFSAALAAINYYGLCVKSASTLAEGPASFKTKLIDSLYQKTSSAY